MKVSKQFRMLLRCCAMLSIRNFETLADMAAQDEVSDESMSSALNDVKAVEDMLFAVSNIFKCEKSYSDEKREGLNSLMERVTIKMLMATATIMSPSQFDDFMNRAKEAHEDDDDED